MCSAEAVITLHAQCERDKVIGIGIHIYLHVCGPKKKLNRTLVFDSPFQTFDPPFQTFAVGLLVEFID